LHGEVYLVVQLVSIQLEYIEVVVGLFTAGCIFRFQLSSEAAGAILAGTPPLLCSLWLAFRS
jgi:hypothetical protein